MIEITSVKPDPKADHFTFPLEAELPPEFEQRTLKEFAEQIIEQYKNTKVNGQNIRGVRLISITFSFIL